MTTLRVIVDQILAPVPGGIGRYTEELTRELISTAPAGCHVDGVISASPEEEQQRIFELLPGLGQIHASSLARREMMAAWQFGFTRIPGSGMIHSPSLLAPLSRHDRIHDQGSQIAVTIHDVVPWTHPETLTPRGVNWHRALAKRAHRYADAVVVDTHAVAAQLNEILDFGDRVRVIEAAVSSKLSLPDNADERAKELGLPERYLLSVGTLEPRKGIEPLIRSLAHPDAVDLPLLIVGPAGWGSLDVESIARDAGLDDGRVRTLGYLSDSDLAVALDRATVFVFPSLAEGFGLPVLEAFSFGTPVVHSDDPAVMEVSAGSGYSVELADPAGYPERLAQAIATVVGDEKLAQELGTQGRDRAGLFSWRTAAENVWQLHADM
jgi:glycosyltransferase involved in cell wall biosynthesis